MLLLFDQILVSVTETCGHVQQQIMRSPIEPHIITISQRLGYIPMHHT